jgi:hypothetical protein
MVARVIQLRPYPRASTLRALARARHAEAVACLEAGDRIAFLSRLRDVEDLTEEMRRAERWEEECRKTAAALDRLLERADRETESAS